MLLDTCFICNVSNNLKFVKDLRAYSNEYMFIVYTNSGIQKYNQLVDLRLLPITVYYKQASIATILSFKSVSEIPGARITLDIDVNKNIILFLLDCCTFVFEQYKTSL